MQRSHLLRNGAYRGATAAAVSGRAARPVLAETDRSLTLRYDNETRRTSDGKLVEWQLIFVAPGVFRWRETDWPEGKVNGVVGIRCSL